MAKKNPPKYRRSQPNRPSREEVTASSGGTVAFRETIESIVIAFVLAFLFRTFEAEAFVIPTGSMSPSLLGQHKDVKCSECDYRFHTTASTEGEDRDARLAELRNSNLTPHRRMQLEREIAGAEVIAGMCPMCRQTMLYRDDNLPPGMPPWVGTQDVGDEPTYPGDRILVNKYSFGFRDPKRWEVVVFKFPGNGEMNYIKRLVGLPEEDLRVYQGDVFIRPQEEGAEFHIERKPPEKVKAMLQPVHNTDFDPLILYNAGWPLRWSDASGGWQKEVEPDDSTLVQHHKFVSSDDAPDAPVAWLRYQHLLPDDNDWTVARRFADQGKYVGTTKERWLDGIRPQLISDFNPYNARVLRAQLMNSGPLQIEPHLLGMEWVTDLGVVCDVEIHEAQGELLLDLVEAGKHFTCQIDLKTGTATLSIDGLTDFTPTAQTPLSKRGEYRLRFANVDDQLLLWVDDKLIPFGEGTGAATYDADRLFGGRENAIPQTSEEDPGDLAPIGIGARGASLTINHIEVLRDIYYISANSEDDYIRARWGGGYHTDYTRPDEEAKLPDGTIQPPLSYVRQLFYDPSTWPRFLTRRKRTFPVEEGQYFVMGDNSPESQDCRLWKSGDKSKGLPGGAYLDARLMTGDAVCVFWPHSWGSIPGLKMLPGFPNFWDMRIVR